MLTCIHSIASCTGLDTRNYVSVPSNREFQIFWQDWNDSNYNKKSLFFSIKSFNLEIYFLAILSKALPDFFAQHFNLLCKWKTFFLKKLEHEN